MKKIILILFVFSISKVSAQHIDAFFAKADVFFKTYVENGKVAYSKINVNQVALSELMSLASNISVSEKNVETYQAFWINAYNLTVIKGIIDNYPIKSPLNVSGFFDKTIYHLGGKQVTLNAIENELLRGKFEDTRFHFVLVCGAVGCPPLINSAYLPSTLKSQLESQTKLALNGNFLKVDAKRKLVEASEIMKWYKEDFTLKGKTEIDFINQYRTEKIPSNYKLSYFPYDWNLNK